MSPLRTLALICSLIFYQFSLAQDSLQPRILLVPFNPDYYFSDADQDIARHNSKDEKEIRKEFQAGLNLYLHARIVSFTSYDSESLLRVEEEIDHEDDLYQIYQGIGYRSAKPKSPWADGDSTVDAREGLGEKIKGLFKKDKTVKDPHTGLIQESADGTYMEAVPQSREMLTYLSNKYQTDFFLFVNQFELKTNYEHCLDRTVDKFGRTVKVHVSLFDRTGNLLYGNAISMTTETSSQSIDAIVAENVQPLIDHLVKQLHRVMPETASF